MNEEKFVAAVFSAIEDKGLRAAFRRADSSRLNFHCVEFLLKHGMPADDVNERTAAFTVMAAIARSNVTQNGSIHFARAIALCYPDKNSDAAISKIRKVCSCESVQELASTLRRLLALISSKNIPVDYALIYKDLLLYRYENKRDNLRVKWMKMFYSPEEL